MVFLKSLCIFKFMRTVHLLKIELVSGFPCGIGFQKPPRISTTIVLQTSLLNSLGFKRRRACSRQICRWHVYAMQIKGSSCYVGSGTSLSKATSTKEPAKRHEQSNARNGQNQGYCISQVRVRVGNLFATFAFIVNSHRTEENSLLNLVALA